MQLPDDLVARVLLSVAMHEPDLSTSTRALCLASTVSHSWCELVPWKACALAAAGAQSAAAAWGDMPGSVDWRATARRHCCFRAQVCNNGIPREPPTAHTAAPVGFTGTMVVSNRLGGVSHNGSWSVDKSMSTGPVVALTGCTLGPSGFWAVNVDSMGADQFMLRVGLMPVQPEGIRHYLLSPSWSEGWWLW